MFQLKGGGVSQTAPFHLAKSFAGLALAAVDTDGYGCVFIVHLVPVGGGVFDEELGANEMVGDGKKVSRSTYFYGGPGAFYFDIVSPCGAWVVGAVE